jgi:integrase
MQRTWRPTNGGKSGSTPPIAAPPSATGSNGGSPPKTWIPGPWTTTAATCAATSCPVGATPLSEITALDINTWAKEGGDAGYATTTIASWTKLLSMILTDAVDQHLIPTNPVRQRRHRGRRCRTIARERLWATPEQVLRIANQAATLGGPIARLLIITAAWTGCRWGELAALHRNNINLDTGHLTTEPVKLFWAG